MRKIKIILTLLIFISRGILTQKCSGFYYACLTEQAGLLSIVIIEGLIIHHPFKTP